MKVSFLTLILVLFFSSSHLLSLSLSLHIGRNPFVLDSKKLKVELKEMLKNENRFSSLSRSTPDVAKKLQDALDRHVKVIERKREKERPRERGRGRWRERQMERMECVDFFFSSFTGTSQPISEESHEWTRTQKSPNWRWQHCWFVFLSPSLFSLSLLSFFSFSLFLHSHSL